MMRRSSDSFSFELPDHWAEVEGGGRLCFQGPRGEALIISSTRVQGDAGSAGLIDKQRAIVGQSFDNALRAMQSAAADPALVIERNLARDDRVTGVECWTLLAHASDEPAAFLQAACRGENSVLFLTLEGPDDDVTRSEFAAILASVVALK
jgi:hypothetical protein